MFAGEGFQGVAVVAEHADLALKVVYLLLVVAHFLVLLVDCESGTDQADYAVFLDEEDNEADCGGNDEIAEEGTLFFVVPVLLFIPDILADFRHYRKNS